MKKVALFLTVYVIAVAALAVTFTDINSPQYYGKTGVKDAYTAIDANFATIEAGYWVSGATVVITNGTNAGSALIKMQADKQDDAGDLQGILVADGGGFAFQSDVSSKGTLATKLTISNAGTVTMANGEILDNATDSEVIWTADDDSASLLTFRLKSSNAHGSMADNDSFYLKITADNDSNEVIDYGTIQAKIVDVTTNTEDFAWIFKCQVGGVDTQVGQLDGTGLTLPTGKALIVGTTTWTSSDKIDGEQIADDTIDDDSIDFSDVTGADITLTDAGAITSSGAVRSLYFVGDLVASATVTNTQAVTLTKTGHILKSATGAATITIANPTIAGQQVILIGASDMTTNTVIVADTGNVECGSDVTLGPNDTMSLYAVSTSAWLCTGTKDND